MDNWQTWLWIVIAILAVLIIIALITGMNRRSPSDVVDDDGEPMLGLYPEQSSLVLDSHVSMVKLSSWRG